MDDDIHPFLYPIARPAELFFPISAIVAITMQYRLVALHSRLLIRSHLSQPQRCLATTTASDKKVIPRKNKAIQQVKMSGLSDLEASAKEIAEKTRKSLFDSMQDSGPDPTQIRESEMILRLVCDALEEIVVKGDTTFCIRGEPVNFFDCEVNTNMRQAKIFWCLPFSLIGIPDEIRNQVEEKMQFIFDQRGSKLQYMVHSKLRHYYPPRLRFEPRRNYEMEKIFLTGIENYDDEDENS